MAGPASESAGAPARRRILFVSEAITLAQVVRLVSLARTLDPRRYEIHFASGAFSERIFRPDEFHRWPLFTVSGPRALKRLDRGGRLYSRRVLTRYVDADREVIRQVSPHLIVGDMRWSLAVSAPLEGIRFATLANAYMSPLYQRDGFPLPDHAIVALLGETLAAKYFPRALPAVFDWFARPLNQLRVRHGLTSIGSLLDVLAFGDFTLYADIPELMNMSALPDRHLFLGQVPWSPSDALPGDWGADPTRAPIYVTVGSSGDLRLLPRILQALAPLRVDVLVATADRISATLAGAPARSGAVEARVHVRPFVSGAEAAARARLVISNGGSTTGYQALAAGCPVLGLPHNLEQHLAMEPIVAAGAGVSISARNAHPDAIRQVVARLLADEATAIGARAVARRFATHDYATTFPSFVESVVP